MEDTDANSPASEIVDRLWRAYAPFQRGRNADRDLTAMLAVLVLARFVDSANDPGEELSKRWSRAVSEARIGYPPLRDLQGAFLLASRHERFPALAPWIPENVFGEMGEADDLPWAAAFLTALQQPPEAVKAGLEEVGDLLLERYVSESTAQTGEFYTPRTITQLLTEALSPQPGDRVLDPACGSGGMLAAAARHIAQQGHPGGGSFEGYAMDHRNPDLAMLNLALHGIERPVVRASDPGTLFRSMGDGMADFVLSNPPFNQRVQGLSHLTWPFGPPPESNANFAWLQLVWTRLSDKGRAGVVMPSGAASARGSQAEVRKRMLAAGTLLSVIALSADLFAHTTVPVHIWLLARDASHHLPAGEAGSVLFIDASRLGTQTPRGTRELLPADTDRVSNRFHAWQKSPATTTDEPGFSCSVPYDEILEDDNCSLDPRLHVAPARKRHTAAMDTHGLLHELAEQAEAAVGATAPLHRSFDRGERAACGEPPAARMPLRHLVDSAAGGERTARSLLLAGPSGSLIRADHYVEADGIPVVMPRDLTGSGFSTASIRHISAHHAEKLERFRLRSGDVVLARRGELGRAAVVREEQQGWVCGTGCFLLRPPAGLDADYFAAYLRGAEARTWLEAHSTGSMKMRTISLDVLRDLPVFMPDLAAQQAIADTMKQLDAYERLLQDQIALTRRIRHDALDGGLIPVP
ncbi:N-6 DNA methylase [Streptomyces sp. NBC_01324]|uniref:N-6 DNA methylase n=1 Tax=Streptomyces sp. NBC_01324 TaxID=2903826 RepID=UPI002E15FE51|nr:N-6 DNA methylase [Streptomyces sp. NBC_01324]